MPSDPAIELIPWYDDGPNPADTQLRLAAERAYRAAFLAGAIEAAGWLEPDVDSIEAARQARFDAHDQAAVNGKFRADHVVLAAGTRGRHQALEQAAQVWERAAEQGLSDERIACEVIAPWGGRVATWAKAEISPATLTPPPASDDGWPEESVMPPPSIRQPGNLAFLFQKHRTETPMLPVKSVHQLIDQFPHLREPVIHGLLREGETMNVIASSKTGKSWLVTDLALAVAMGRPWLDAFPCERGNVLIIDNELHKETSAHRIPKVMQARGIRLDEVGDRLFVANVRGRLKDIISLGAYFNEMQSGQYRLIILDAFYRFMPKDTDENDNGTMAQVYNHLDAYAARLHCSFVLVHHSSKGNQSGKAITDVGAGAGSQSRATDTHLVLRPHEEDDVVVLDAAVRSWPPIQPRCLRWTFPVWTLDDSLDPAELKPERPRRKPKPAAVEPAKPADQIWDAESFAAAFVTSEPATKLAIEQAALKVIPSERRVAKLLKLAEHQGLIHRWKYAANRPSRFATVPQSKNNRDEVEG